MALPFFQVDAFCSEAFKGNPAGVVILESMPSDSWLQQVAAEINASETAFLLKMEETDHYQLRWFTPTVEVPICGHATLSAAKVIFNEHFNKNEVLYLHTQSGILTAKVVDDSIELDFPADVPLPVEKANRMTSAFEFEEVSDILYGPKTGYLLIRLPHASMVKKLKPNMNLVRKVELSHLRGVIITAKARAPYHFVSRFFDPWEGIDEDPVTGSAHTVLAPYWSKILKKEELFALQASARGGEISCSWNGGDRVIIRGKAVIVLRGILQA